MSLSDRLDMRRSIWHGLALVTFLLTFLVVFSTVAVKAQENTVVTYWTHTTAPERGYSLMRLYERRGNLYMEYAAPRQSLLNIGVNPGQVFFEGRLNGNIVTGRAAVFKPGCPIRWYEVSGAMIDQVTLELRGPAPQWEGCQIVAIDWNDRNSVLRFYLQTNP